MSPTYAVIPHRLIPGISGASGDAENLTVTNTNAGGFGTAEWDTRSDPGLAKGDAVEIDCEGARLFEGKVASVTSGIGEKLSYHVSCIGHFDELKEDETVEGVFVDRDVVGQWQVTDCNNWSVWPDGQIACAIEDNTIRFFWPDLRLPPYGDGKLMCDQAETSTSYAHEGNAIPHFDYSDFSVPKKLWTAACYRLGGGATSKRISGFSFEIDWYLETPNFDAKKTSDYTSPIGPPDAVHGHRFSVYPKINYWTEFYGLARPPDTMFFGVYCCDDPSQLPVGDPWAMRNSPYLIHQCKQRTHTSSKITLRFPVDGKFLIFYATYIPVILPMNLAHKYSQNADHLVRTNWVARNRLYTGGEQYFPFVVISNPSVYAQGYESQDDGSDDLKDVFAILFPTAVVESMPLPAPIDDTAPTSIALRSPTTKLAAIPELLSLYPVEMCWGVWEDKILTVEHDAGSVSITDEPGVDTTGAALSDEGAVDLVQVAFAPNSATTAAPGSLNLSSVALLIVDKDGAYSLVEDDWEPAEGQRVAFKDATSEASSEIAAARIGQALAISRRPAQWTGSVALKAIDGASTIRPGKLLSGAGITNALVTQTTVNVEGDQVSLALGNSGYVGRFPARVPGKPLTASPTPPPARRR